MSKMCKACKGTKVVETYDGPSVTRSAYIRSRIVPCATCEGTGFVDEEELIQRKSERPQELKKPVVTGDLKK